MDLLGRERAWVGPQRLSESRKALRFFFNVGFGSLWAFISGMLVYRIAPSAAGSGIPEVKTILNGFVMQDVVSLRTLAIKIPGLMLSVAAGMSLGKEGPLVHVAVCWAQLLSRTFPQRLGSGQVSRAQGLKWSRNRVTRPLVIEVLQRVQEA